MRAQRTVCYHPYLPANQNGIIELFNFDKKELGVILALLERGPTIVPRILAELEASGGSIGRDVKSWYDQAKAELDTVPATKS